MYGSTDSSELCFVCDAKVMNKGICLSVEETFYTKTAFPTKISELMGDDFLVVVCEEDRLCARCAALFNQSDKLEVDLREVREILSGFLNAKYNLNKEDAYLHVSRELKNSTIEDDCEDSTSVEKPITSLANNEPMQWDNKHGQPNLDGGSRLLEGLQKCSSLIESAVCNDLEVKTEPQSFNSFVNDCNISIFNKGPSNQYTSDVLQTVLSKDDTVLEKELSAFNHCCSKADSRYLQSQSKDLVDEVNVVKLISDYKLVNTQNSLLRANTDVGTVIVGQSDLSKVSDNYSPAREGDSICLDEKPDKSSLLNNVLNETVSIPEAALLKDRVKRVLTENSTTKTTPGRNNLRKESKIVPFRKLRPILPKITKLSDISLLGIENTFKEKPIARSYNDFDQIEKTKNKVTKTENQNSKGAIISSVDLKEEKSSVVKDQRVDKTNKNLSCKICKTNFETVEALKTHGKEHTKNRKLYSCGYCEKTFKSRINFSIHEASHTGKFAFCCDFCGRGFMYRCNLEEHRRKHTKEEHYICDVCGKKFSFQSTYWIHRKWHDNPYPYKCNECGRLFKHSSLLSVHRRKHTGERPYKCSYCPLTFNVTTSLKRHLILHTKEYPYKCDACKQGFTTRFRYSDHMARIHSVLVDKPPVEKKDYKVAVYDDVVENASSNQVETMDTINIEIADNSILSLSEELSGRVVEIVLGPSVLSDHDLSLSDSWLI